MFKTCSRFDDGRRFLECLFSLCFTRLFVNMLSRLLPSGHRVEARRSNTCNSHVSCFVGRFFVDGPCTKPGTTLQRNAQKNEGHFSVPAFLNQEAPIFNVDVTNASEKLTFELPYLWCPRSAALRAAAIFRTLPQQLLTCSTSCFTTV